MPFCNNHALCNSKLSAHSESVKNSPKIYIIVKQLSKAKPKKNLHTAKLQKFVAKMVANPETKPTRFVPTRAGIRP